MRTHKIWLVVIALGVFGCGDRVVDESKDPKSATKAISPTVSLTGSDFEVDVDANLTADNGSPSFDWASVTEDRQADQPSGQNDDSFGQGSKEDTAVPAVVSGSIPPNKSDLLNFGVYLEKNDNGKFLHMFWHRVQEPSGTTNMDFEFNQGGATSTNGVTPDRVEGDLLIQYDLSQGGTNPTLFLSRWITDDGSHTASECEAANKLPCWSQKTDLSAAGNATGSINTSAIAAADSDGLGDISPRTFGEASVNFGAIVAQGGQDKCFSFGGAYLKSRSSDSFTAALKDFIAPLSTNISNCGNVKVLKADDNTTPLDGAQFVLVKDAAPTGGAPGIEDTEIAGTCTTSGGECGFASILSGEYWVVETAAPAGHDLASPAYKHVSVVADETVTVAFVNPRQRGAIIVTKTRKHAADGPGDHPHVGVNFTVNGVTKATGADGTVCFDNLLFANYTVTETVPPGYTGEAPKNVVVAAKASCAEPANAARVSFSNMPLSDITVSFSSQIPGGTAAKISCTGLTASTPDTTPDAFDDVSETFTNLLPGTYTCTVVVDP